MSIKSAIRRLETQMAKNKGGHIVTFIIPYTNEHQAKGIKEKLIESNGLEGYDGLITFIVNFAQAA